jgi:prepilin-type N-terminal cleavage/methylation domain-containing protein
MKDFGFTLIELIMVIIILAMLVAAALPKYVNLKIQTIEKSEDAIIAAIGVAAKTELLKRYTTGDDSTTFSNPFSMLESPPPYAVWFTPEDNYRWRYINLYPSSNYLYIHCLHYNSTTAYQGGANGTKGRFYALVHGGPQSGYLPGDCFKIFDLSH